MQTQLEKELQSARELIYTQQAGPFFFFFLQPQRGEEAIRVIGVQRKPPAARSLRILNTHTHTQKRWPNEFMAAELISCAIKVLRFFSMQHQWLHEIN